MAVKQKTASIRYYDTAFARVLWCVTLFTLCTTLLLVYRSRTWGLLWDAAIWHYVAWLITEGAVPYRDVFDVNFPGTYIIHLFVIKCIGGGDVHWRIFDLLCLAATNVFIVLYCRPFGRLAGWIGVALFSAFHLYNGPMYIGQRDYYLLLFVLGALYCFASGLEKNKAVIPIAVSGLLLGAAFTIKPYVGLLCFVLLLVVVAHRLRAGGGWFKQAGVFTLCCCLVPVLLLLWLAMTGGLQPFFDILFNYLLPFYSKFVFQPMTRSSLLVFLGIPAFELVIIVALALAVLFADREHRMRRLLLVIGMGYGFLHFYLQVRNFYQLYPFVLFMFLSIASWAGALRRRLPRVLKCAMVLLMLHVCLLALYRTSSAVIGTPKFHITKFKCTDELAAALTGRVSDSQTVQVMDSISGGIHALYNLRVKQPTRFIYDSHLFHDIEQPYIRKLRFEFMDALTANPPEFLVFSATSWPLPGYGRLDTFSELAEWVQNFYRIEVENDWYRIYRYDGMQ